MLCVYYYCQHNIIIIIVSLFQEGNTCLHTSSEHTTADAVAFFISKGLDISATNNVSIIVHCSVIWCSGYDSRLYLYNVITAKIISL